MDANLYELDFHAWCEQQAERLLANDLSNVDWANVAEEIGALARSERTQLRSRLRILLLHLLKYRFQPTHRTPSWRATIRLQRREIEELVEASSSLRRLLVEYVEATYPKARDDAADETGIRSLPVTNPFTLEDVLRDDFFPD